MAAFTFGSFGDILTLTNVVITCARSLNDSTGSVSDYQDFINELSSLKEILELVVSQNQDSSTESSAVSTVGANGTIAGSSPLVLASIRSHVEQCRSVMETFHQNVKSCERGLNRRGAKSWWYKMVWSMWKKDQIMTFRAKLATHRQQIMALLLVSHTYTLSRIETEIPRSVKFTLANSIELVDALGTRAFFHIDYCSTWKALDSTIKIRFENAPGGRFVRRDDYDLSCNNGKQIILPHEWPRVVKPGMVFEMSIILRQEKPWDKSVRRICPICGYRNGHVEVARGFIDCLGPGCNARFQASEVDEDELWDDDEDLHNLIDFIKETAGGSKYQRSGNDELKHFRNVHVWEINPALDPSPRLPGRGSEDSDEPTFHHDLDFERDFGAWFNPVEVQPDLK